MTSDSSPGRPDRSGSSVASRASTSITDAPEYGGCPVAANSSVAPSEYTSLATDASRVSRACSGAMYAGVPTAPRAVVRPIRSAARATPKSITRGPSGATSTLDGFRSRCTRPGPVDRGQRLGAPGRQPAHRAHRQRAARQHQPGQRRRRHVRRGQPGQVGLRVGFHHRGGEHPAHLPGRRHLLREPGPETSLLGQLHPDRLDRDQPARGRTSQVDLAHRPGPQAAQNHVRPDPLRIPPAQCFPVAGLTARLRLHLGPPSPPFASV